MNNKERLEARVAFSKKMKGKDLTNLTPKESFEMLVDLKKFMFSCPVCGEPYVKEDKYKMKPNCEHNKNMRFMRG